MGYKEERAWPSSYGYREFIYANKRCALLMRLRVHNRKGGNTSQEESETMRQGNKENCETGVGIKIVNDTGVKGG